MIRNEFLSQQSNGGLSAFNYYLIICNANSHVHAHCRHSENKALTARRPAAAVNHGYSRR